MNYSYVPTGVCPRHMSINIEDNIITSIVVMGGCNGNLKGINALIKGMDVDTAIEKLQGITCGFKPTSCPDQIAKALIQYKEEYEHK